MKILYLSRALVPTEQSNSLSIMRVCQALHDAGHEVLLSAVSPTPPADEDVSAYYGLKGGFEVHREYLSPRVYNAVTRTTLTDGLVYGWRTRELLKRFAPDYLYSRLTVSELTFVPSSLPIIYEMHSLGPLGGSRLESTAFRSLVRHKNFRRIIVTTDALKNLLAKEFPSTEIVVARLSAEPPIEISAAQTAAFRGEELRSTFRHNVGYTGYLDTINVRGTDIICQIAARMPDVGFHIVGGDETAVEHWRRYAAQWNKHGNIALYGYRNPSEIPLFLSCLDVVLSPLQFRPKKRAPLGRNMSPLKIPQYMAYGKAIVASKLNAHLEILEDGKTGFLVEHDDVAAWVTAITRLLESPTLRASFGAAARAIYESEFTPARRVAKILDGLA